VTRITFLDDDHVMRLARLMLSADGGADERWLRAFFEPEPIDLGMLLALGAGLRRVDGVEVELAVPDGSVAGSSALVFRRGRVTREVIEACPDLRLVQRLGVDASCIDLDAARARGVEVSCLPRRTLRSTAEHVLLLMLALSKRLLAADRAVRAGERGLPQPPSDDGVAHNWAGLSDVGGLAGRTLGIVGLGEVGTLVARLARAFEMRVLYSNRTRLQCDREARLAVEFRPLDGLLAESDFVSVHVPGTPANEQLIGAAEIRRMGPGAFLINTSRGRIVDEDALYDALVEERLAGAALDVHRREPRPAADRFCRLENVILTPHVGGGSRLGVVDEVAAMFDNVRAVLAGQRAPHGRVALDDT
jgi:phosphoglycerate dehydrogenase-like enzyme